MTVAPPELPGSADEIPAGASFSDYLAQALERFADPDWLGTHSPLTTPYFLGNLLTASPRASQPRGRGQTLQRLLLLAALELAASQEMPAEQTADLPADTLKDMLRHGTREQQMIYWKFIHQPRPPVDFIIDQMIVARATYHRTVKKLPLAMQQMAAIMLRLVRPSLRLEQPPAVTLLGREALLQECQAALARQPTLMMAGSAGVGKTALAAGVAARWQGPVFWYGLRSALNDSPGCFLLMLGLFLHTHGASQLWLQMVVDGDSINPQIAANLALADLRSLGPQTPLLCIDTIEILVPGEAQRHVGLRALINALAEATERNAALLCVGREPGAIDAQHLAVPNLALDDAGGFLRHSGVLLPRRELGRVFEYTQGNIQALKMLTLLYHSGETFEAIFERMPQLPSMAAFARRLRERLAPDEQRLVTILAVFRQPVSAHAWREDSQIIQKLGQRQIVQINAEGSISLWPALRDALGMILGEQERAACHRVAATVRAQAGQHTAAAYHYIRSGHPAVAIRLWFPNREQEIRDGQAGAALALFQGIDPAAVGERDARALALSIVQLGKLTGETAIAIAALGRADWPRDQQISAHARMLEGDLLDLQSHVNQAARAYQEALDTVAGLPERQQAVLHTRLCNLQLNRFRDLDAAWREACQARHIAELFQGEVLDERGDHLGARAHFQTALAIAEELNDPLRQARTHFNLALIGVRHTEEAEEAMAHFEQTMRLYAQLGDLVRVERTRTNLAAFLIEIQRHRAGIEAAARALAFFESVRFTNWAAINATNLSEAHLALGEYAEAERYAQIVLGTEEPASIPYALTNLGNIRLQQDRPAEAETLLREALAAAEESNDRYIAACAWRSLGQAQVAGGKPGQARAALTQSLDLFNALDMPREIERTKTAFAALPRA